MLLTAACVPAVVTMTICCGSKYVKADVAKDVIGGLKKKRLGPI